MKVSQAFARARNKGHLTDERLLAAWEDGARPPHLEACESCRARAGELRAFLDAVRESAVTEADRVFTPDRLAAQQAHVLRRLARTLHPARVITFPAAHRAMPVVRLVARRWVALAAAAGLLIGLVLGTAVDLRPGRSGLGGGSANTVARMADARSDMTRPPAFETASFNEEAFLSELESAVTAPRVEELQDIDALTPHVREVSATLIR